METMKISGYGSEITAAIRRNSAQSAYNSNVKQAKKYLAECEKSGNAEIIEYGKMEVERIMKGYY